MDKVSLWWDMVGCALPSQMDPFVVRSMANSLLQSFNIRGTGMGHQFRAYKHPSANEDDLELEKTMFNSGIHLQLVQPALVGYGNEIEKMIMADMLLWAIDMPPPGDIILIVGNVDFSYVIHKLRERSYNVFLVCSSIAQVSPGMLSAANECFGWLTFLRLLEQNEEKLQFPSNVQGWVAEYYRAFSPVYIGSSCTVSSKELEEYQTRSSFDYISENSFTGQSAFNDGWDLSHPPFCGGWDATHPPLNGGWDSGHLPLNEAATETVQQSQGPGFQVHCYKSTKNTMDRAETKHVECKHPTDTKPKKKVASMGEFKAWLRQTVYSKENENGYNIYSIRKDFEKASGKTLDIAFGVPKILSLLDQCNDIAKVKEVKKGVHLAFPVKTRKETPHRRNKPNPNPNPNHKSTKQKPYNSQAGINTNHNMVGNVTNLEEKLEVDHPSMVQAPENQAWKDSICCKNLYNLNSESAVTEREWPSMDLNTPPFASLTPKPFMDFNEVYVHKQEAKAKVDNPSACGSIWETENKACEDNISCKLSSYPNSQLAVSKSEWPFTLPFTSSTLTEPHMGFQEYSNKLDSSGTPQGLQVSQLEGQFYNVISNCSPRSDSCQLERSEYVKQSISNLHREGYASIGNAANTESLQNMGENKQFCKEVIRGSETVTNENSSCSMSFDRELSDSVPLQLGPRVKELKVTCDISMALSLLQSLPQESVVCLTTSQDETRLDSKQSAKSAVNEEGNVHTVVSPAESIMEAAGRGLKRIYKFSTWRKDQ